MVHSREAAILPAESSPTLFFAPAPSDCPDLAGEVHLWRIALDAPPASVDRFRAVLSSEERGRADRLRFAIHRKRFIIAHAALRLVLGQYLPKSPPAILLDRGGHGKPHVVPSADETVPQFNLTHSGDLALLAVAPPDCEVGLDLEQVRNMKDMQKVAASVFTPAECEEIFEAGESDPRPAFFRAWTRKEAVSKAEGKGFSLRLDQWQILAPETPPGHPPITFRDPALNRTWLIWDMRLEDEYRAAMATAAVPHRIRFLDWRDPMVRETS